MSIPSAMAKKKYRYPILLLMGLTGFLALMFFLSFAVGRYPVPPGDILTLVAARVLNIPHDLPPVLETVVFNVRLPRIIAAMMIGTGLAVAGAAYQGLFRNPLVSPDVLGASAGAALGAALAIFMSLDPLGIQLVAFLFGLLGVTMTYAISTRMRSDPILSLILCGILMGAVFSALISLIKFAADPLDKLPAITFWLMGSLSDINMKDIAITIFPILGGSSVLMLLRWRLNVLTFGEEEAQTMGLNVTLLRSIVIVCATVITSAAVSISGLIGWVGLVIPHLARMLVGPDYRYLMPTAMLMGAAFLLMVDDLARLATTVEIPIGILTALLGVPFFLYFFSRRRGW